MVEMFDHVLNARAQKELREYFHHDQDRDVRPDVISKSPDPNSDTWPGYHVRQALDQVLKEQFEIEEVLFHKSWTRYGVHADSGAGQDATGRLYKAVLFPLETSGSAGTTFVQNHWNGPSAKFTKAVYRPWQYNLPNRHGGVTYVEDLRILREQAKSPGKELTDQFDIDTDFMATLDYLIDIRDDTKTALPNRPVLRHNWVSDYSLVSGYSGQNFPESQRLSYCDHVPAEDLHGLTFDQYVPWTAGSAIVFDRTQIHCTGNGDLGKLGLTVFTNLA